MATLSTIKTGNSREKGQDGRSGKIQGNVQTFFVYSIILTIMILWIIVTIVTIVNL